MKKDKIKEVLNNMVDSIDQQNIELYNKLIDEKCYGDINNIAEFYYGLLYPHEKFINGLIKSEISNNNDVVFILTNSKMLEMNFRYWIEKVEGSAYCADKTRTILNHLYLFYKDGTKIVFDYTSEYTYQLPKTIFKSHESIIEFYEAIEYLYYGNPTKYLNVLKDLIKYTNGNV
jgi:hypothetical protein